MTSEQLRQIDELIAEKVMGWVLLKNELGQQWLPNDNRHPDSNIYGILPPKYSSDTDCARLVWDKMVLDPDTNKAHDFLDNFLEWGALKVDALNERTSTDHLVAIVLSKIGPLRICLAALKTKGIEIKDKGPLLSP